jgi:hypothetical protein
MNCDVANLLTRHQTYNSLLLLFALSVHRICTLQMADISGDLFDGLLFPSLHDISEPSWLAASAAADAAQLCPASSAASPCDKQHPLLRPCESEETTEDVFDSLDAFLAAEFPELDSECIPCLSSPTHSSSHSGILAGTAPTTASVPALSCSSTDSHGVQLLQQHPFSCSSPTSSGAPDVAESAAAAAATAAAAKAQAQAYATMTSGPFSGMADSSMCRLGSTASTTTCSAAATTATGTGSIPRWKLYHMQQRQELLAPKPAAAKAPAKLQVFAGQGAAVAAPAGSCGSPSSNMSSGAACLSPVNALASTASAAAGLAAVAVPAQVVGAEQLLLLNLHQQQQLALQQQCAVIVGAKRPWAEPVGAPITVLPCKAKRSRVTAAGNTAAQHMYGLTAEPSQQMQTLQVLQLQLQQQIQQNYQQQAEIYQQSQLQALHNQLHMRLQVQQHPLAFQPPVQTRHKRQASRATKC